MPSIDLDVLVKRVSYGGNPEHKKNPGDFGLTPPCQPKADKSLCDEIGIFKKSDAEKLLREGIRRGLISKNERGQFPQNVWAVTQDGIPVEAQLENLETGIYHGYPMPISDSFYNAVLSRWGAKNG